MSLLPLTDKLDLDDVLVKFKIYGRYHVVSYVLMTLALAYHSVGFYTYIFVNEAVGYRCADNRLEFENAKNSSNMSDTNYTQKTVIASWCEAPVPCPEWVYDKPDSFVAEFQLACQDWKRTLVGSVRGFANMVGLIIVGPLSDRIGRRDLAMVIVVADAVLGTAKSFVTLYWLYIALDFLQAAVGDCSSPLFMLGLEMVATRYRVTYTAMCSMAFGLGGLLLPLLAWLVPYWRTLLRVAYAPGLLLVSLIYLLDESPRWLLANGKKASAVKILRNAAKRNQLKIEDNLNTISYVKGAELSFVRAISDTFKSRSLLKRFFVSITWWFACTFVVQGLTINSVTLVGNKYVNFGLTVASKIPSSFLVLYTVNKLNRKGSLILSFVVCAIVFSGQAFVPKKLPWLLVLTYMLGKFTSSTCLSITYLFTSELFPTHTRNSMHALCSSIGRIGSIMAPQTPLLMVYWSGLPTMTFGAVSLTAGLLTLLVPDTGDQNLPDTVCQAESLGQNKS